MSVRRATLYCAGAIESWRACAAARSAGDIDAFAAAAWRALVVAEVVAVAASGQLPEFGELRGIPRGPWTVEDARRMVGNARSALSYAVRHLPDARRRRVEGVADAWAYMVESELLRSPWASRPAAQPPPPPPDDPSTMN